VKSLLFTRVKFPSLADELRTYWPRAGPVGAYVPDLGDDRPCENCGYNLRGLPFNSTCPECGATSGIVPVVEAIPWNERQTLGSFFGTALIVITAPGELAAHVWKRDMIWLKPARKFRRINVALATISVFAAVMWATAQMIGLDRAVFCAPLDLIAVLWWFISLTNDPRLFFQNKGNAVACLRAAGLSYYLAAPLILSPLHLGILALPVPILAHEDAIVASLVLHVALIGLQLLTMAAAESALLWQLVELPRGGAFAIALGNALLRAVRGAVYVVLIPAVMATMVKP
jgi:hypothetical protein